MGAITKIQGTRTSLTTTAMDSLASDTFVSLGTINFSTNDPIDALIEVKVTPGTVSGNKRVVVYAQGSLDGTNFETGPTSGTSTTDEPVLTRIGVVPCNTNSAAQTKVFSLANKFDGPLPAQVKLVVRNETGAALAASGHHCYYAEITGNAA